MNDCILVSVWQDVFMEQPLAEAESQAVRAVDNVDMLKAMADPTRMAILAALMKTRNDLPVMSVKELAAELGEPQTKLYRHVRQLEAVGLIKVASTRMVSGILEQRYQASQQDLIFGRGFIQEHADESMGLMQTLLDRFRDGFFAAFQANRQSAGDETAVEPYRKPVLLFSDVKISPAKAAELRDKLEEIMNDLNDKKTEDPNGIPVNLLIGCFVPGESDPGTQ
jgi:DNA-binding transcriptional ArsR family regulator